MLLYTHLVLKSSKRCASCVSLQGSVIYTHHAFIGFYGSGQTDGLTDTQTDMTKLIVVLRNFANAPKNMFPGKYELKFPVLFIRLNLKFQISDL